MPLQSILFRNTFLLQACLERDTAHIAFGAVGDHVEKIQAALMDLDGLLIAPDELAGKRYGRSTATAVLSYKTKRRIINLGYQTKPDDIVGKMTIAALDKELIAKQKQLLPRRTPTCHRQCAKSLAILTP
jgi:diketogulonate reductase-like aldo/keto reductase